MDGKELELPPVVLGTYGNDTAKKTILVYGHYDVQPALMEDGWHTDPFKLHHDTESGRMYGRGYVEKRKIQMPFFYLSLIIRPCSAPRTIKDLYSGG